MDVETLLALIGGMGGAISVIVTSLRKRQDISVEEMQSRIISLERDNKSLHEENEKMQSTSLAQAQLIYQLRLTLINAGIPDPMEKKQ